MARTPKRVGSEGFSLVETIIAIGILGFAVVFIVGAMNALVVGSSVHRDAVTHDTVMRDYAESVKVAVQSGTSWCRTTPYTVAYSPPTGYAVSQQLGACPSSGAPQYQVMTLAGSAPDNRSCQSLIVTIRQP